MQLLKKVINKHKFSRVKNNHRTFLCKVGIHNVSLGRVESEFMRGFLLDNHLYIAKERGVYPHTRFEYYAYYVGEVGGVHYRTDNIMFYKVTLATPF